MVTSITCTATGKSCNNERRKPMFHLCELCKVPIPKGSDNWILLTYVDIKGNILWKSYVHYVCPKLKNYRP